MRSKHVLTTDEARQIISAARAEAGRNGRKVSIAVVDDGGHLLALERLDSVVARRRPASKLISVVEI